VKPTTLFLTLLLSLALPAFADVNSGVEAYKKKDYSTALREFQAAAEQGDAVAQYSLGVMYANAQGVERDFKTALSWLRKAAEQGHVGANANIGDMYGKGLGVEQNFQEAAKWYRKAADQGEKWAQLSLGMIYFRDGELHDFKEAANWFRKAAEQGQPVAQYMLATMLATGQGVTKDETESFNLTKKSAIQGFAPAQSALGFLYMSNIGDHNRAEAERWIRLASQQKDQRALNMLKNIDAIRVPGETHTSFPLQWDAWKIVAIDVDVKGKCEDLKSIKLLKTEVFEQPLNVAYKGFRMIQGQWSEKWTAEACGKQAIRTVRFLANGSGGATFSVLSGESLK